MVDIPVRQRRGTPLWVWLILGLIVLIIVLAVIDYFVTNIVLNRPPAGPDGGQTSPFSMIVTGSELLAAGIGLTLTSKG